MPVIVCFETYGTNGREHILKKRLNNWLTSRIRDRTLPENMEWTFGHMRSISSNKYSMAFESLKLLNFRALKNWHFQQWYQETKKPRNHEACFIFISRNPHQHSTYRLPPLHQPPSWGTRVAGAIITIPKLRCNKKHSFGNITGGESRIGVTKSWK